ncbi:MAG TPA: glycoside hydrolase family 2 TIM barrel-domain containing protein, partial [Limnochordia bacterium]
MNETAHAGDGPVGASVIDLAGTWRFRLDPGDEGIGAHWYAQALPDSIRLPGSLQEQGYGEDISVETGWIGDVQDRSWFTDPVYAPFREPGNVKVPFWLQPEKHYVGVAWYQRAIEIPPAWAGKRVLLTLTRPHWETRVWLDEQFLGTNDSLSTPHVYALGPHVRPGSHTLTIRVDNRMIVDVGRNAHSVSDHTQTNWNGIVGPLTLSATDPVWLDDIQVHPDVAHRAVRVHVRFGNEAAFAGAVRLRLRAVSDNPAPPHAVPPSESTLELTPERTDFELTYALGPEARLWDEFQPALYRLDVAFETAGGTVRYAGSRTVTFGLREFGVEGTQFTINGRKTFLRGTLECAVFPLTGYPPTEVAPWRRILRIVKAHGLNHVRFHSWCPPEAAFAAADECGVYFQIECAAWARIGEGKPVDEWLYREAECIVRWYGNHPSFVLMAYGNEPHGEHQRYLSEWVAHWRRRDPRRLHTGGSGWPVLPENEFHVIPEPRIQRWGEGLKSRINSRPPETVTDYREVVQRFSVPVIAHEIGQWCAFPNFEERVKYTGSLKAK